MTCDCDYHKGGCTISKSPPTGFACRCIYKGGWTCGGEVTRCRDTSSAYCKNPDQSIHTCAPGGGDCDGYQSTKCDCDYKPGGCRISKVVAAGLACRCQYEGFWTCSGEVVKCKDPTTSFCDKPDSSVYSCVQGGGDCGGYGSCDCEYHSGGCSISKAAPQNTACKCVYKGGWTCGGEVTHCRFATSTNCLNPDYSIESCTIGGGDCGGYKVTCDCDYQRGGCVISRPPPASTSCKCKYKGFWTCSGEVIACRDYNNHFCQHPDGSKTTCILGGGDCGGY